MATKFLIFLTLFSLLHISTSSPTNSNNIISNSVSALSDLGHNAMSLTLEFGSNSIILPPLPSSLTIFTPHDTTFADLGQPSLHLLQFHFSPLSFSPNSLPYGSKIPTLYPNHSLFITSNGDSYHKFELNGVKIDESPVYNDGSLTIFEIDQFFNPNFQILDSNIQPSPSPQTPSDNLNCGPVLDRTHSFEDAIEALRKKGFSMMASCLDLQATPFSDDMRLTVFAATDGSVQDFVGDSIQDLRSICFRHFVPCRISMSDLASINHSVLLQTKLPGFLIHVGTNDKKEVILNQAVLTKPEIYSSDWLIVHGLNGGFTLENITDSSSSSKLEVQKCVQLTIFLILLYLMIGHLQANKCSDES